MSKLGTYISHSDLRQILSPSPRTKTLNPKHYFVTDKNSEQQKDVRNRLTEIYALITQLDFFSYDILKKTVDSLINNVDKIIDQFQYCTAKRLHLLFLAKLDSLLRNNNTGVSTRQFNAIKRELNYSNCGPETFAFLAMKRLQGNSKNIIQTNGKKRITVNDYIALYETKLLQNTTGLIKQTDEALRYAKLKRIFQGHSPSRFAICCLYLVYNKQKITWKRLGEMFSINTNGGNFAITAKKIRLLDESLNTKVSQGKKNIEFLISILLVARPKAPQGLAETMRHRLNEWFGAGICDKVKLSSGVRKERIKRFLEEYS